MASTSLFTSASPLPSASSLARKFPPSAMSVPPPASEGRTTSEAELEAERQWWSEASERQVKDLEKTFGNAFRKTAEKLTNDVAACKERLEKLMEAEKLQRNSLMSELTAEMTTRQDRLEALLESEKHQRNGDLLDLKRNLDAQQLALTELSQQQQYNLQGLEARLEDKLHAVLRDLSSGESGRGQATAADQTQIQDAQRKLRSDFDSLQIQVNTKEASFAAEWAHQKSQMSGVARTVEHLQALLDEAKKEDQLAMVEASVRDLRRDVTNIQEAQQTHTAQANSSFQDQMAMVEASVRDLRRDVTSIQEAQQTQTAQANSSFQERVTALDTMVADLRKSQEQQSLDVTQRGASVEDRVSTLDAIVADLRKSQEQHTLDVTQRGVSVEERVAVLDAMMADMRKSQEQHNLDVTQQGTTVEDRVATLDATVADLRRAQEHQSLDSTRVTGAVQEQVASLDAVVAELRKAQEQQQADSKEVGSSLQERMAELDTTVSDLRKEQEQQRIDSVKEQVAALGTAVTDLRMFQEQQNLNNSQTGSTVEELRCQAESLRATAEAKARTDEEVRAFHEVIMQSTCDLGRGLEEITNTVVTAEEKLRKEINDIRNADSANKCSSRLAIEEEAQRRTVELTALRARLDVAFSQLEELQAERQAPASAAKADLEALRDVVQADMLKLRGDVEAVSADLRTLGDEASRGRAEQLAARDEGAEAKRRADDLVASCREQMSGLEEALNRRLGEALAQERATHAVELSELRRLAEVSAGARQAPAEQLVKLAVHHEGIAARDGASVQAVEELRSEMVTLRMNVRLLEQRCEEALADPAQAQATAQELRRLAARLDQAEAEVHRVTVSSNSLGVRMDSCANEVWKSSRDMPALLARLDVVESDMKHLARESGAQSADVGVLKVMLGKLKGEAQAEQELKLEVKTEGLSMAATTAASDTPPLENTIPLSSGPVPLYSGHFGAEKPVGSFVTEKPPASFVAEKGKPETSAPPPVLSADLKASIGKLVQRVNATLASRPVPETGDQSHVAPLVQAVQELRERNVSLREENAGIVEELLAEGAAASPKPDTPQAPGRPVRQGSMAAWQAIPVVQRAVTAIPNISASTPKSSLGGSVNLPTGGVRVQPSSGSVVFPVAGGSMAMPVGGQKVPSYSTVAMPQLGEMVAVQGGTASASGSVLVSVAPPLTHRERSPVRAVRALSSVRITQNRTQSPSRAGSICLTVKTAPWSEAPVERQ